MMTTGSIVLYLVSWVWAVVDKRVFPPDEYSVKLSPLMDSLAKILAMSAVVLIMGALFKMLAPVLGFLSDLMLAPLYWVF